MNIQLMVRIITIVIIAVIIGLFIYNFVYKQGAENYGNASDYQILSETGIRNNTLYGEQDGDSEDTSDRGDKRKKRQVDDANNPSSSKTTDRPGFQGNIYSSSAGTYASAYRSQAQRARGG